MKTPQPASIVTIIRDSIGKANVDKDMRLFDWQMEGISKEVLYALKILATSSEGSSAVPQLTDPAQAIIQAPQVLQVPELGIGARNAIREFNGESSEGLKGQERIANIATGTVSTDDFDPSRRLQAQVQPEIGIVDLDELEKWAKEKLPSDFEITASTPAGDVPMTFYKKVMRRLRVGDQFGTVVVTYVPPGASNGPSIVLFQENAKMDLLEAIADVRAQAVNFYKQPRKVITPVMPVASSFNRGGSMSHWGVEDDGVK